MPRTLPALVATTSIAGLLTFTYIALAFAAGTCVVGSNVWNGLSPVLVYGSWIATALAVAIALVSRIATSDPATASREKGWQTAATGIVVTWILLVAAIYLTGLEPGAGALQGLPASVNACI